MDQNTVAPSREMEQIMECVRRVGKLDAIHPQLDIYSAGLRSIDALNLLMELEDLFQLSIPDDQFIASRTPAELHDLLERFRTQ